MSNNQNTPKKGENTTPKSNEAPATPATPTTLKTTPSLTPPTPEPDPVAEAKAELMRKQIEVGQKFARHDEFTQMRKNLHILTETRENLREFRFSQTGDVSNVAVLIIRDSAGKEFTTRRTALIEENVDFFENKLNQRILDLTEQVLSFELS